MDQRSRVQVSYPAKNTGEFSTKIPTLAEDYTGELDSLNLDSEKLVMTFVFLDQKQLMTFVSLCTDIPDITIHTIDKSSAQIVKSEFLKEKISKQIDSFKKRKERNQKEAIRIKFISTALAAITTILLGLNGLNSSGKLLVQNIAFTLSAAVTLMSALDTFFNHRGLWIRYQGTLNDLYELRTDLEYLLTQEIQNVNEEELDRLYQRYQIILKETNSNWSELRKEQKSTTS
ncbi:DUF4231 domain-containing protein [Nostoc sp.]|uniref:DUF4231 domain-containing protein n=1 Tax=Nostoc sp. TaxID=1180 RepID=UPI002FFC5FF0